MEDKIKWKDGDQQATRGSPKTAGNRRRINQISGLEFQLEEALQNEKETNQNIDQLKNKLESLETCVVDVQQDSEAQRESLNDSLCQKDEKIKNLQEEIQNSKTQCSDIEFQIKNINCGPL